MKREFAELLFRHPEYNIVGHMRPDGDCVGSQLAICRILQKQNIKCNIIKNDDYGRILENFFKNREVIEAEHCDPSLPLICVDCSDLERTGKEIVKKYSKVYLNIDHHISNKHFADNNIVSNSASSVAEVIADLLIREKIDFDKDTAEMLYLGIMTDSGNFAYSSTTLDTIRVVECLMAKGISISEIYQQVYERDTMQKYRLLERMLKNLVIFEHGLCCTSFVTHKDMAETGAARHDTEGFVNYTRKIDGVKVGAFLECDGLRTKCSMRSSSPGFRMDILAERFGGGGHPAAAGFTIDAKDENFYEEFKMALAEHTKKFYNKLHCE